MLEGNISAKYGAEFRRCLRELDVAGIGQQCVERVVVLERVIGLRGLEQHNLPAHRRDAAKPI